jgi:hypothetical protein
MPAAPAADVQAELAAAVVQTALQRPITDV